MSMLNAGIVNTDTTAFVEVVSQEMEGNALVWKSQVKEHQLVQICFRIVPFQSIMGQTKYLYTVSPEKTVQN